MTLTTPPRPYDLLTDFPEMAPLAKPAVRLHPRPGAPTVMQSSIGGPLSWPADEPWPMCYLDHAEVSADLINDMLEDDDPVPLIPLAQLFYRDVPGLPFADQFDLLQILWCPRDHINTRNQFPFCPAFQVRWSRTDANTDLLNDPPQPDVTVDRYMPNECVVHPEAVTEYPDIRNLPKPLREALTVWHLPEDRKSNSRAYSFDTAHAPGWKAMGHGMYWGIIDPFPVECECGTEQLPLFTADSTEFDDATSSWRPTGDTSRWRYLSNPVGVTLGRAYTLQLFYCPESETHPCRAVMA